MKKALAPRSEETALDRVEATWTSFEECFAMNASIERVFPGSRGRIKNGPAHLITVELVAGSHPLDVKTKVATALDPRHEGKPEGAPRSRIFGRARSDGGLGDC